MDTTRRTVAIFRETLFEPSETFIYEQADSLARWRPIFVGRKVAPTARVDQSGTTYLLGTGIRADLKHLALRSTVPSSMTSQRIPGVVHAHFAMDGVFAAAFARRLGVPLIVTLHGMDVTTSDRSFLVRRNISVYQYLLHRQSLFEYADAFLCVSEFIRDTAIKKGFPADKCKLHHIGSRSSDDTEPQGSAEAADGAQRDRILHVGRLVEKKGAEYLIRALPAILMARPNATIMVVGDGPLRAKLERIAVDLNVASKVQFLGQRPHAEVLELMRKVSVLCLPSVVARSGDAEGLGMVLLEAAEANLPIVATDHGGIVDFVVDGVTGLLCPERDAASLADRLARVLSDNELRRRLAAGARSRKRAEFNLKEQTAVLEALYDELAVKPKVAYSE